MTQLALPAPYGYAEGFHISLLSKEGFDERRAEETIVRFGCPRRIAQKAISCLHYSNRYDCVVSPFWFSHESNELREQLRKAGVEIHVQSRPNTDDPGLAGYRIQHHGGPRAAIRGHKTCF